MQNREMTGLIKKNVEAAMTWLAHVLPGVEETEATGEEEEAENE